MMQQQQISCKFPEPESLCLTMTIPDEPVNSQSGKNLEKTLDAVAALRLAMQQRLFGVDPETPKPSDPLPSSPPPEKPSQTPPEGPTQNPPELPGQKPLEQPSPKPKESPQPAEIPYERPPEDPPRPRETPGIQPSEIPSPAPDAPTQAPPEIGPPPQSQKADQERPFEKTFHTKTGLGNDTSEPSSAPETKPIHFDPVEWSRILFHVAEESQGLISDYLERMRHKPLDSVPFTPTPLFESVAQLSQRFLEDPEAYTDAQIALWQHYIDLTRTTLVRLHGQSADTIEAAPNDKRFKAKDWQTNWMFDFLKQAYLSTADEARRLVQQESSNIDSKIAKKIEFYTRLFLDATAPNNFWMTNPEVLRATLESQGENLIKGLRNLLEDLERGNGTLRIRMSDYHSFQIGKNIAASPGQVVFQNELMQLIQYAPSTATVKRVPLLIIPPWINKYYILDLRENNSFIKFLVGQGYTVFCISWVNPTKRHALTQFEDYMDKGALEALREIKLKTGEEDINVLGYCIGGTLLACTQAYIAANPVPERDLPTIKSSTYLVTMVDFADPGDIGVFIDEDQIRMLEDRMARQGFMDAGSMMLTFNLLRANDLIWPFVINNYLLGREPFPFDILYWNADATNLPAAMQSYYLRKMYLDNKLVGPGALKMKNVPLDLAQITTPTFILATREDHIAPWRSTYAAANLYSGPVTFVLSASGHVAGIVNPPGNTKYGYWINPACPENPEEWLEGAQEQSGSWWTRWVAWLSDFSGQDRAPREITEGLEPAPGSYVKVRAV